MCVRGALWGCPVGKRGAQEGWLGVWGGPPGGAARWMEPLLGMGSHGSAPAWGVLLNGGGHCCGEPRAVPFCPSVPPCSTCTSICLSVHLLPRLSIHLSARPYGRLFLLRRPPPPFSGSVRPPPGGSTAPCATSWRVLSSRPVLTPRSAPHCLSPPRLRTPSPPPSPSALFTSPSLTHTAPQHLHVTAPPAPLPPPGEKGLTAPGW